jgi:hypothetical protein
MATILSGSHTLPPVHDSDTGPKLKKRIDTTDPDIRRQSDTDPEIRKDTADS